MKTILPAFEGETPRFPPPPKVPTRLEVAAPASSWIMAFQTFGTIPPKGGAK